MSLLLKLVLVGVVAIVSIDAHGFMVSPAARNSAWRFGFGTPENEADNRLFCGGRKLQHYTNGGHCGICGDPWQLQEPRPHERGGKYGLGVITANYTRGQVVPVTIHVAANHQGYYEFRLCDNNDPNARDSQECLDKHLLQLADGTGTRYYLTGTFRGRHVVNVQLPENVSCSHCVLQWTWVSSDVGGKCPDGERRKGCGPQQNCVNCADVRISGTPQPPPE